MEGSTSTRSVAKGVSFGPSGLPLLPCPRCGEPVIELVSRSKRNPGKVFFKCPNNEQEKPGRCQFYMWLEQYEDFVQRNGYAKEKSKDMDYVEPKEAIGHDGVQYLAMNKSLCKLVQIGYLLVLSNVVIAVLVSVGLFVIISSVM